MRVNTGRVPFLKTGACTVCCAFPLHRVPLCHFIFRRQHVLPRRGTCDKIPAVISAPQKGLVASVFLLRAWYFRGAYSQHTLVQLRSITRTPRSQCQRGLSLTGEWEFSRQTSACQAPPSTASHRTAGSRWRGIKKINKKKTIRKNTRQKEEKRKKKIITMMTAWLIWACIKQEGKGVDHGCFVSFFPFSDVFFSPPHKWFH